MKRMMKALSVLLAAALVMTAVPCFAASAERTFPNTHVNTGNMAADIVAVAETQNGYCEGSLSGDPAKASSNNLQKFGQWYDANVANIGVIRSAWCAAFVSWCANQAGVPSSIVYYHAYCPYGVNWFKNQGRFSLAASRGGSYIPNPGDIVYFAPAGSTSASHVGIVRYASGGYVYTAEGNTSGQNGEVNEGGGVFLKKYSLSYNRLYGYGTPAYTSGTGTTASKIGTYTISASELNVRKGASTDYDVVDVVKAGDIVYVSELDGNGWGKIRTPNGSEGWCSIERYGTYIGVDAIAGTTDVLSDGLTYSITSAGGMKITNGGAGLACLDLKLAQGIGTMTTPYMSCQIEARSGGYYFGFTKAGSGYWMMRDCKSGDELVEETSAPFMTGDETLQINLSEWWKPKDKKKIDTVRLYLDGNSEIQLNYFYFAAGSNIVTDSTYNYYKFQKQPAKPMSLLDPANITFASAASASGSLEYNDGTLQIISGSEAGLDVNIGLNKQFRPEDLPLLLLDIKSGVPFNVYYTVTTSAGDMTFSLGSDFFNVFGQSGAMTYLPAADKIAALSFLGCYTWNGVLPADGESVIKSIMIRLSGKGAFTTTAMQFQANDALVYLHDGIVLKKSTASMDVLSSAEYEVGAGFVDGVVMKTSVAAFKELLSSNYTINVYDGARLAAASDKMKTGMTVKVTDGSTEKAAFTVIVRGDLSGSGTYLSSAAREIVLFISSVGSLTDIQKRAADMDEDGAVTTADARNILCASATEEI